MTSYSLPEVGLTTTGLAVTDIIDQVARSLASTGDTVPSNAGKSTCNIKTKQNNYFTKLEQMQHC